MAFQHDKACILNCIVDGGGYLADAASIAITVSPFGYAPASGSRWRRSLELPQLDGNLLAGHYNHVIQMSRGNLEILPDPVGGAG